MVGEVRVDGGGGVRGLGGGEVRRLGGGVGGSGSSVMIAIVVVMIARVYWHQL